MDDQSPQLNGMKPARVRFAPSPTGHLHIGGLRTALFNWLFARHTGGQFILRIEDTDQKRFVEDSLADLMDGLRWLGLNWDEGPDVGGAYGPYVQSQRQSIYKEYASDLVKKDRAYRCYCTPERLDELKAAQRQQKTSFGYDRRCRHLTADEHKRLDAAKTSYVIRLAVPLEGATTFQDRIRGSITIDNQQLQDAVLFKSDGMPTYHLAVVVDDHLMQITHIMRSDEWISSTPLHTILYDAFGWEMPVVAHLPVILDPSGPGKMSKRKKTVGDKEYLALVHEFRDAGYVADAMFNFLANVGWNFDPEREKFTREEAIQRFSIDNINPGPAKLPYEKLDALTGEYIRAMDVNQLKALWIPFLSRELGIDEDRLEEDDKVTQLVPLVRERMTKLTGAGSLVDWAFVDAEDIKYPDPSIMIGRKLNAVQSIEILRQGGEVLSDIEPFDVETLQAEFRKQAEQLGVKVGSYLTPFRGAITGKKVAPPLFESMVVIGRDQVLRRIQRGVEALETLVVST